MSNPLERRMRLEAQKVLSEPVSDIEWAAVQKYDAVGDVAVLRERGLDWVAAVEPVVSEVLDLRKRAGQLARSLPQEAAIRPPGSTLEARYSACEAWLTADLGDERKILDWRASHLLSRAQRQQLLDRARNVDEAVALLAGLRRRSDEHLERDVRAWVLQRFADEGGAEALEQDRERIRNAQMEVYEAARAGLDDRLYGRWQVLFKPIEWTDTVNLAVPTPEGPRLQTVLRRTSLGQLAELVNELSERHLLVPASVTAFVVGGHRVEIAASSASASMSYERLQPGSGSKIVMTLDPTLSPEQVAASFRRVRNRMARVRPAASEKQGRMVEHVVGRVQYGFENLPWSPNPRTGPGRRPTSDGPRFVVQPLIGESWTRIVADWNATERLAELGRLNAAHASRDFAAAFLAVFQPLSRTD